MRTDETREEWLQLWNGSRLVLSEDGAQFSNLDVATLAQHLAKVNRFVGATIAPYSVAQHSVLVAGLLRTGTPQGCGNRLYALALLHDAAEAFTGDIPRPVKRFINARTDGLVSLERAIDAAVHNAFGLELPTPSEHQRIKRADNLALSAEARDLLMGGPQNWEPLGDASGIFLERVLPWRDAWREFNDELMCALPAARRERPQ